MGNSYLLWSWRIAIKWGHTYTDCMDPVPLVKELDLCGCKLRFSSGCSVSSDFGRGCDGDGGARVQGSGGGISLLLSHHHHPMGVPSDLKLLEQEPCGSGPRWLCYHQVCCFTLSLSLDLSSQRRSWWSKGDLCWPQAERQGVSDVLPCRHLQLLLLLHWDVSLQLKATLSLTVNHYPQPPLPLCYELQVEESPCKLSVYVGG